MSEPTMSENAGTEHRDVIDEQEASQLDNTNPNVAASGGDNDHENHIGDEADDADDDDVARAGAELDRQAG